MGIEPTTGRLETSYSTTELQARKYMAHGLGVKPRFADSKSAVLSVGRPVIDYSGCGYLRTGITTRPLDFGPVPQYEGGQFPSSPGRSTIPAWHSEPGLQE